MTQHAGMFSSEGVPVRVKNPRQNKKPGSVRGLLLIAIGASRPA